MSFTPALTVLLTATPTWTAVAVWNDWRRTHPEFEPDFRYTVIPSDLSLAAADLHQSDFSGACLRNVSLRCAQLSNARFCKADLRGADLSASDLTGADLTAADLRGADLRGAELSGVRFGNAHFDNHAVELRSARQFLPFDTCDLSNTELRGSNLQRMNLTHVRLNGATLVQTNLSGSTLAAAQLRAANLREANLQQADLTNADLSLADLTDSNLRKAHLIGASMSGAQLKGAQLEDALMGWTNLSGTELALARDLDRVVHLGPSVIDIDNIVRCFRGATESPASTLRVGMTAMTTFVRGVGVPENILELARNRSFSARHASCFISHSSKDLQFVKKFHSDLQDEGVRCWYAPEAIRVGEHIRARIQEGIRQHGRLVVVLSESSMQSGWVKFEVDTALEEEKRNKSAKVLLPIGIDGAIDDVTVNWVKVIRSTRSIGDFRGWTEQDRYRRALRNFIEALLGS